MFSFLAAQYGTISDIEILWILIAASGLVFSLYNLHDAWGDRKALITAGIQNGRRKIANFAVRSEGARAFIQIIFLTIGLLAMTYADPPDLYSDRPWNLVLIGIIFRWGLITAAGLISLKSFWAWRLRRYLKEDVSDEELNIRTTEVKGTVVVAPSGNGENHIVAKLEGQIDNEVE